MDMSDEQIREAAARIEEELRGRGLFEEEKDSIEKVQDTVVSLQIIMAAYPIVKKIRIAVDSGEGVSLTAKETKILLAFHLVIARD